MSSVARNLEEIRERMSRAAERSGRSLEDVTLVGVTKTLPIERIREAIEAGVTHLGENRVQEADSKFASAGGPDDVDKIGRDGITLHMIGGLQRNKARRAVELFDWVQSVDRVELAMSLDKAASEIGMSALPVLIEVNTTGEPAKSGVMPAELPRLADALGECKVLRGMGLMTVARINADETELRQTFGGLKRLLEGLKASHSGAGEWKHLSMGMSDDYEIAIEEGSTMVRLGRAVFGERA
ncbi:MAG: YggS family pyridoxal phosphate-dependent enzyme [Chloroflexia bacterium]